ncbi:hypothetical protein MMC20_004190 [Loxospora ochrophaea]|nr:hypothetical protein [Loxospora ochrophaea]
MLEQQQVQLVNGLQELYKRNVMGQGWTGPLLQDFGSGRPLTHDILDHLGVLKQDTRSDSETFEDDLDTMQQRLIAGGADLMQRRSSSDSDNEQYHGQISFFDPAASNPTFPEPFASAHLPTPPVQSPRALSLHAVQRATSLHPQALHAPGCPNSQPNLNPTVLQQQTWTQSPQSYSENLDFLQFERTSNFGTAKFSNPQRPMAVGDPCPNAAMPDWAEDDFNSFLNTSMV